MTGQPAEKIPGEIFFSMIHVRMDFKIEAAFGGKLQENGPVHDPDRGPYGDLPEEGFDIPGV